MKKIAIIGVGLIGGSLGQALRQSRRWKVLGISRKKDTLRQAKRLGAIDEGSIRLKDVVSADFVVITTPVAVIGRLLSEMIPFLKPGTIITDAGSVKGTVLLQAAALDWPSKVYFGGSHPLAGSHQKGVAAARADLFEGSTCVIVPFHRDATPPIMALWKSVGATPKILSATAHDRALALTSHLPHLIAQALVQAVARQKHQSVLRHLVAGSFRDMTRVASSDPELWNQIFKDNRDELRRAVNIFSRVLKQLSNDLGQQNLKKVLSNSQSFRKRLFPAQPIR